MTDTTRPEDQKKPRKYDDSHIVFVDVPEEIQEEILNRLAQGH